MVHETAVAFRNGVKSAESLSVLNQARVLRPPTGKCGGLTARSLHSPRGWRCPASSRAYSGGSTCPPSGRYSVVSALVWQHTTTAAALWSNTAIRYDSIRYDALLAVRANSIQLAPTGRSSTVGRINGCMRMVRLHTQQRRTRLSSARLTAAP